MKKMANPNVEYTVLLDSQLNGSEVEQIRSDLEKRVGVLSVEKTQFKRLKMNKLEVQSSEQGFRDLWGGNLEYKHDSWYCDGIKIPDEYKGKVLSVDIVRYRLVIQ